MKISLSIDKIFDLVGKIGVMLVTGGIVGAVFTKTVPMSVALTAVLIGLIFGIIGSLKINFEKEDR